MNRLGLVVVVFLLFVAGGVAFGFYEGWFEFQHSTDGTEHKVQGTITVDQDKIKKDEENVENKVKEFGENVKEKFGHGTEKVKETDKAKEPERQP
jgi:hypothetical protein